MDEKLFRDIKKTAKWIALIILTIFAFKIAVGAINTPGYNVGIGGTYSYEVANGDSVLLNYHGLKDELYQFSEETQTARIIYECSIPCDTSTIYTYVDGSVVDTQVGIFSKNTVLHRAYADALLNNMPQQLSRIVVK